ncbi:MAG TPA: hypothetical protein VL524_09535 [Gemmatimonadaceae bacterium]|jgi:hypothetical protein|nr:hypothetical protein [Gemmatimonadaceae bacterium]
MERPSESERTVRIDLSPEQTQHLRATTGLEVTAIELTLQELEQRIAPRIATNHNETMLTA